MTIKLPIPLKTLLLFFALHSSLVSFQLYAQDTVVCYGDSVFLELPASAVNSIWHYRWQRKLTTEPDSLWSNIGTGTSITIDSITQAINVRCRVDTLGGNNYNNTVMSCTVSSYPAMMAPVVSAASNNLCYGDATSISVATAASGGSGTFTYKWMKRSVGTGDTQVQIFLHPGAYNTEPLTVTTTFWVVATNDCGSVVSNEVTIVVDQPVSAGTISPTDTTICNNSSATMAVTGSSNVVAYQWQYTQDQDYWGNAPNATATAAEYHTSPLTTGWHHFRLVASSEMGCKDTSGTVSTVHVLGQLTAAGIESDETICYGHQPGELSITGSTTGGFGNYSYEWWQQSEGATWQAVDSATSTSYQPPALTVTTQYKLRQTDSLCGFVDSDPVSITVLPQITHAQIASQNISSICYDSVPEYDVHLQNYPIGGGDGFGFQWQDSTAGNEWTDIDAADQTTFMPGPLQDTTYYRLVSTSSYGCVDTSNTLAINVYDQLKVYLVDSLSICFRTDTTLVVHPSGGGGVYTFHWEQSNDGDEWSNLSSTDSSYSTPLLESTTFYRVRVESTFGCSYVVSQIKVNVLPILYPGTISAPDTTVCYNTRPENIVMTSGATGDGYQCQWQWSTDNIEFSDIEGQTDLNNFLAPPLKTQTWFRLKFHYPIDKCIPVYSDTVVIQVFDDSTAAHIFMLLSMPSDSVNYCFGDSIRGMDVDTLPVGGDGTFLHHWEWSLDREIWTDLTWPVQTPGNALSYQHFDTLQKTRYFRLVSVSSNNCPHPSNEIIVNVYDLINAGKINDTTDTSVCYNTSAPLHVHPTGGGDDYSFLWLEPDTVGWRDAGGSDTSLFTTALLTDTNNFYRFQVVAISNRGCSRDTSAVINVHVNRPFRAGRVFDLDSVCDGNIPNRFCMVSDASGGKLPYSYHWLESTASPSGPWHDVDTERDSNTCYQPDVLHQTTYYKLVYISAYEELGCRRDTSNTHTVRVDQLPRLYNIVNAGDTASCYNQYQTYALPEATGEFSYVWSTSKGSEITPLNELRDTVEIFWESESTTDTILVSVTNNRTQCERGSRTSVSTNHEKAPDRTTIVRKPNSNILVAKEAGEFYFQWGYTDLQTNEQVSIPNSNRRYVLLPSGIPFDTLRYDYWLEIRHTEQSPCYSLSHYKTSDDEMIQRASSTPLTVTSLGDNQIKVMFDNPDDKPTTFEVFDIAGRLLHAVTLQALDQQQFRLTLPSRGVFLVEAMKSDGQRWTEKAIVR